MRNVPDQSFREDESTNFMFNKFCLEIVIYEIMWEKTLCGQTGHRSPYNTAHKRWDWHAR